LAVEEVPENLSEAGSAPEAKQKSRSRSEKSSEIDSNSSQIGNTVQAREVREGPIEGAACVKLPQVFVGELTEFDSSREVPSVRAAPRNGEHARRNITGENGAAMIGQVAGIFASTAVQLENARAWVERLHEPRPNLIALCAADDGVSEEFIVGIGAAVEGHCRI